MSQNELRRERLLEYVDKTGSGRAGLISVGLASWLLNVSRIRIYTLIVEGRLEVRCLAGQQMLFFPSVFRFYKEGVARELRKTKVVLR